jgi:ABC-2 type transport system ATP-binding protein
MSSLPAARTAPDAPPRLALRGLRFAYGSREVLRGLDLEVRRGEVYGLLGPNGSGKSTALAVLAGLRARQAGDLRWDDEPMPSLNRAWRARTGVVFQSPSTDPKLTARQNLLLAGRLHGLPAAERRRRAERGLEEAGLTGRGDDLVGTFSGGMTRRLDLARALLHEPALLLMDEPTSGLDEAAFRETWDRLEGMRSGRDLTILVATHRSDEAARCDRLAVIADGRVATVQSPEQLRAAVGHDVVALAASEPEALRVELQGRFGLEGHVEGREVLVASEAGHELIPRLVEGLPEGRVESVSLRRPTLADAFFHVVGRSLDDDVAPAPAGRRGSR